MTIDNVYPSLGESDKELPVAITGEGFTPSSRVSVSLDTLNRMKIIADADVISEVDGYACSGGSAHDVAVAGNTAYVAHTCEYYDSGKGDFYKSGFLQVIDVTDPTNPQNIIDLELFNELKPADYDSNPKYYTSVYAVAANEKYAYVATGKFGLKIINVSDPTNPQTVKTVDTGGTALDIDLMGSYALVTQVEPEGGTSAGLLVVDISSAASASVISSVPLKNPEKVSAGDSVAYVSREFFDDIYGLTVIDLHDVTSPQIKGSIITLSKPGNLTADGPVVFLAGGISGLQVIDTGDPQSPEIIGSLATPAYCNTVEVDPEREVAYLGLTDGRVLIVTISNASVPEIIGTVAVPLQGAQLTGLAAAENLVYALDESTGKVHVIDSLSPTPLTILGAAGIIGTPSDIAVVNNNAYISVAFDSDRNNGALLRYDISNPASPVFTKLVYLTVGPRDMVVQDNTAFILGRDKLLRVNLNTMGTPQEVALSLESGDSANVLDVEGTYVFIATNQEDLVVVNGSTLNQVTRYSLPRDFTSTTTSIVVEDDIAYITKFYMQTVLFTVQYFGFLHTVDVSTPASPASRDSLNVPDLQEPLSVKVQGSTAYVADGLSDLLVFNVSDPDNLSYTGKKWSAPDSVVTGICGISDDALYVMSDPEGVLMFHTDDPANPVLIGSTGVRWRPRDGKIFNGNAYVVESNYGLTVAPLPVEPPGPIEYVSSTLIKTTLPIPPLSGNYTVRVFNGVSGAQLAGAVTFTDEIKLLSSRAIVVPGGGPLANNQIWAETKAYANAAYDNLIYQGYKHEDIYYITDQYRPLDDRYDPQLIDDYANVKPAVKKNLQDAITEWAKNSSDLLLFMEDHGETERFLLRGGANPVYVTADELDSWLDTLQNNPNFKGKVIVVYDACYSGSLIAKLTPPPGKTRLILTSSSADEVAYFLATDHSFSSHFWSTFSGKSGDKAVMSQALQRAAATMASYQTAQLDADGDGVPNQPSDNAALEGHEGTIYALRRQYSYRDRSKPVVGIVSPDKILSGSTSLTLMAQSVYDIDGDGIVRVWAEIYAPDFNPDSKGRTVVSLPAVSLAGPDADGTYQSSYSGFATHGTYIVTYYAEDGSGIYSLAKTSLVRQNGGTVPYEKEIRDQYELDNTYAGAQVIVVNDPTPQNHSFHTAGDEDWVKFYGVRNRWYTVKALQPTIISNPKIQIYGPNGTTLLQTRNSAPSGVEESLIWQCPADGLYYVRMTNSSGHYGANVRYKLRVYNPTAFSLPGYVKGKVRSGGTGVAGAVLRAGGGSAISQGDGSYLMSLESGTYGVSVSKTGYQSTSFSVTVPSGGSTTRDVYLTANVANAAPTINGSPLTTTYTYEWYSFTPVAADPNNDALKFSITGKPGWASFNTATGTLSGLPTVSDTGAYGPYTISVSDGKASASLPPFTIQVELGSNLPPAISGSPSPIAGSDREYSFTPDASDPNGDSLSFTISGRPAWAIFAGGRLTGVPGDSNIGKTFGPVSIRISDPKGAYAILPGFTIRVVPGSEFDKYGALPAIFLLLQQ